MKRVIFLLFTFIFSIIIIDIALSIIFEKKINKLINNKIEVITEEKSRKQVDWSDINDVNNIPFWDAVYRWPTFWYKEKSEKSCRILWLGDSIIWWSWVEWNETYFNFLNNKLPETELLNFWIPWSDFLQQIIKYDKESINDSDLLIWHIWEDDVHMYQNVNGVLYNASVVLNEVWEIELTTFIPKAVNTFLIKYSYLYNELLIIKNNNSINKTEISNQDYLVDIFIENINKYKIKNKKILIIFSPSLKNNTYRQKHWRFDGYPWHYKEIENKLKNEKNINFLYLDTFLTWIEVQDIRYDDCCHFNKKWHEIIADKLYNFIKLNNLLDEKCY